LLLYFLNHVKDLLYKRFFFIYNLPDLQLTIGLYHCLLVCNCFESDFFRRVFYLPYCGFATFSSYSFGKTHPFFTSLVY